MNLPTSLLSSGSLVAGFAAARYSGVRPLGAVVLVAGVAVCARDWSRSAGTGTAVGLTTGYLAAFGLSHPLAKAVGAWPSVLAVSAATGVAAHLLSDRRAGSALQRR